MPRAKLPRRPAVDPPNAWDVHVMEGPDAEEIMKLLDELSRLAESDARADTQSRFRMTRRNNIWARLATLGVTMSRMKRAYAVDGVPRVSHVTIMRTLQKMGVTDRYPQTEQTEPEEPT